MPDLSQIQKGFSSPGELHSSKANAAGAWLGKNVPKILSPVATALKDTKYLYGSGANDSVTVPGWLSSLGLGGLGGAALGGLAGYMTGNTGRGALIGGGLGALGLSGLGYTVRNPDWASKLGLTMRRGRQARDADASMGFPNLSDQERYLENKFEKKAYGHTSSGPIIAKIYRDNELTLRQKQELASQVGYLNEQQTRRLNQIVGGAFGSGIGMLIAKYLLGLGKFGTILTTIVSGLAGVRMAGGRKPKSPYDSMGRPYYM
jgi:hypothetical protein